MKTQLSWDYCRGNCRRKLKSVQDCFDYPQFFCNIFWEHVDFSLFVYKLFMKTQTSQQLFKDCLSG